MNKNFKKDLTLDQINKLKQIEELANSYFSDEYENKVKNLLKKYKEIDFENLRNSNKKLLMQILIDFINAFPEFKNLPCAVYLHGSYSRLSYELYSDVDITIFYDSKYEEVFLPLEELLNLLLIKCFKLGERVKVHSFMMHLIESDDPIEFNTYSFDFGKFNTFYDFQMIDKDIYRTLCCKKDKNSFYEYIIKNLVFIPKEFCFNFEKIYDNYNIVNVLNDIDKMCLNDEKDYRKLEESIAEHISSLNRNIAVNFYCNQFDMKQYKSFIKINPLHQLYNTLSIFRKFLNMQDVQVKGLNIDILNNTKLHECINKKLCLKLKKYIVKYLYFVSRIRKMFKINNINFSTKNDIKIDDKFIQNIYNNEYKDQYKDVLKVRNKIYSLQILILKKLKRRMLCTI